MLNAFRHQRIKHLLALGYACRSPGVLNAFRHQRIKHAVAVDCVDSCCAVLNAFRHQRIKHEVSPAMEFGTAVVLNAFRHQRIKHRRLRQINNFAFVVLNAFRHQRIKHKGSVVACPRMQLCSTPFGINESNTRCVKGLGSRYKECSTPFGINESNTIYRVCKRNDIGPVLNAFRHQRIKHGPEKVPLVDGTSAQRLSASTNQTRVEAEFSRGKDQVLNAFRHQRIKH